MQAPQVSIQGPKHEVINNLIKGRSSVSKLGLNVTNIRSNSVGGIGVRHESQLQEFKQQQFNIQNGVNKNKFEDDLSFPDARGNPVNYLLNPLVPQLTPKHFVEEVLQISTNKLYVYHIKKITQLRQLNRINEQNIRTKLNIKLPDPYDSQMETWESILNLVHK